MKKIGIFGGTFDPIHNGHLHIAETVLSTTEVEEIVFMPSAKPPHKPGRRITSFEHRMHMVRLAIDGYRTFSADDVEFRLGGTSYTVRTIETLKKERPDTQWFLIIGSDSLLGLPSWKEPEKLIKEFRFIVFPRTSSDPALSEKRFLERSIVLNVPLVTISSSDIRSRVGRGEPIDEMVPAEVERYIALHKLYLTN
jgi:nicotinate-nucleotide adenylyltransferase